MGVTKGLRLSEQWFQRGLWLIALIFAGFVIGLGSLVVGDLPRVERPFSPESFADRARLAAGRAALKADHQKSEDLGDERARADDALSKAQAATSAERDEFQTWIATRSATQQSDENPEVLRRTAAVNEFKARERAQEERVEALESERIALEQDQNAHQHAIDELLEAGRAGYDRAVRREELRVFGLRLLLTLPLLVLALWLFMKRRKGPRWPFVWGFAFFALYTFFFELVPYLPSYGGYLRYIVGIVLTVWVGNSVIASLRRYLEAQKEKENRPEAERRRDLGFETAQVRLAKRICPACERPLNTEDASNNFCMNCGLLVFDNCERCGTRQTTFSHFCRACGLAKHGLPPEGGEILPAVPG